MTNGTAWMADGNLFHTYSAATGNVQSPKVEGRCHLQQVKMAAALNVSYLTDSHRGRTELCH